MKTSKSLWLVPALIVAGATGYLTAGPLTPPAGPVTSTYKTLSEVEPRIAINATNTPGDADSLFKITQRGSYYLTGNITGVAAKHGIEIAASGVTVDLNGFDLVGPPSTSTLDGVRVTVTGLSNIVVLNGSVRNWGGSGVDVFSANATNGGIEGVCAVGNGADGIRAGRSYVVARCVASSNTAFGIFTDFNCTITACSATDNNTNGIDTGYNCTITGSTALSNTGNGINTFPGCTITECAAYLNSMIGINAGGDGTITECSANWNDSYGIDTGFGCTITGCTANNNVSSGIRALNGSSVKDCTVFNNSLDGVEIGGGSSVVGCTSRSNHRYGIFANGRCLVKDNNCSQNGTAGDGAGIVLATAGDNRVEGNNLSGNKRGIDVFTAGNIIIRNTISSSTQVNWNIVANNVLGPILDRTAPGSGAVFGNTTSSSLGTTDANANFTY